MEKDFDSWNNLKKNINNRDLIYASEREVWFCSVGLNVGSEQDGKNETYERPVLVIKKVTINTFIGVPLTSNKKKGSWYIPIASMDSSAVITQIKLFDTRRLTRKMRLILIDEFDLIKSAIKNYL